VTLNMHQNCFCWESLAYNTPLVGWGRGHPLDLSAFRTGLLWRLASSLPPSYKFLATRYTLRTLCQKIMATPLPGTMVLSTFQPIWTLSQQSE